MLLVVRVWPVPNGPLPNDPLPNDPLPNIVPYFLLSINGLAAVLDIGFTYFLLYSALLPNELNSVPFFYYFFYFY